MQKNVREIPTRSFLCHLTPNYRAPLPIIHHYGESLPYLEIKWSGLERLCYLLLLREGKVPRFFGNQGQKQYGIDLLVTEGDDCTVYQCKNVKSFTPKDVENTLELFSREWLGRTDLPKPNAFVLCCPVFLRETNQNEKWTTLANQFYKKTDVKVTYWHRDYLDERLKQLPDLVADLFSDQMAEQFCEMRNWNIDLFRPLILGSGERAIETYLTLKLGKRIHIDLKYYDDFTEKIETNGSLLIRGLPGTGKTTTALALAELFQEHRFRIFYVDLRYDIREDDLVTGIKRRLTRPTIFILDNCHGKYEKLDNVQARLTPNLNYLSGQIYFVFLARTIPTQQGMPRGVYSTFEEGMQQTKSVLDFKNTPQLFQQIIALTKPNFAGLSKKRLEKVFHFCGGDLFLLDQLVNALNFPSEIDVLQPETLYEQALIRYFYAPSVSRPGFMNLAALAQFDIAPPVDCFGVRLEKEDSKAASQLVIQADRPPCYFFLHSSAAELIFRALVWNNKVEDYMTLSTDYLIDFFNHQPQNASKFVENLSNLIRNPLKLTDGEIKEKALKGRFLNNKIIITMIDKFFHQIPLNIIGICLIILEQTDEKMYAHYLELIENKINNYMVLDKLLYSPFWELSLFLNFMKIKKPLGFSALQNQFYDFIMQSPPKRLEIQNFLMTLSYLSEPQSQRWITLVESISDRDMNLIIQNTIASGRSIGTINIMLWQLKESSEVLLQKLEKKMGAERYLYLISHAGTIFELFMLIRYSTPAMSEELIDALDTKTLDTLVDKTIASGRSIGTLDLTLKDLKKANLGILNKLETKIGTRRWLRLIQGNGTVKILGNIMRRMTTSFKNEMAQAVKRNLSIDNWQELLLRGDFEDFASFIKCNLHYFPKLLNKGFLDQIRPTFETLIRTDNWQSLNNGMRLILNANESPIKNYVLCTLRDFLVDVQPRHLQCTSFSEAVNCISMLWQEAPSQKNELIESIQSILPEEGVWYDDENFLRSSRSLFICLSNREVYPEDAHRVLKAGNADEVAGLFEEASTLDIFLYLWNLYSLWFEWEGKGERTFPSFLHPDIQAAAREVLKKRLQKPGDQNEIDNLIILIGLLSFWGMAIPWSANNIKWLSTPRSLFVDLLIRVVEKTFVPGAFFLLGLEDIFDRRGLIAKQRWLGLLDTTFEYTLQLASVADLRNLICARAGIIH